AGPQGSFVPKAFSAARRFAALTDLGFIVVQIDGMGTAHRSKAFHDVCWHNLKDAGFPDRILWHQAVAKKYPYYDLTRVGITGVSAGGQNATAGVLFHPEFYHVAVSACGCHDNRMDKASWNEQWMGYPVGPWYSESSNIDNAHRLRGKLLLLVGEMDTNVPPESTMRLVDALIKANKDFELLVVPNAGHGLGGSYGQRQMYNFFVGHLLRGETEGSDAGRRRDAYASSTSLDLAELNLDRSELRGAIERFDADRGSLMRSAPTPLSPSRDERVRDFTERWLDRIGSLDFDRLTQDGKVDYLLLKNHLAHELRQSDLRAQQRADTDTLVPFTRTVLELDETRRALEPRDWSKVAGDLTRLTKEITEARRKLESQARGKSGPKRATANRALAAVEGLRGTRRGWFSFEDGYDPLSTWWMQEPYQATDQALQAYAGFLRQRYGASDAGSAAESGLGPARRRGGGPGGGGSGPGLGREALPGQGIPPG